MPCPGGVWVWVGAGEVEGEGEVVPPAALPLGVGAAVVTSKYSTSSTKVVVGTLTLV